MSQKGLVVVTGASSGIGAATAQLFAKHGHPLLLLGRRLDRMTSLNLPNTMCSSVDVTDYAAFSEAVVAAEAQYGPVECLVNNAGVMLLGKVTTQDLSEWKKMLDVNVMGALHGIRAVIAGMTERRSGCIINISSIAGIKTFPDHGVYCASKYALHALNETFREECSQTGVKFVEILPGVVETELLGHTTDAAIVDGYKRWKESSGKMLEAEDVARTIYFAFDQPAHVCIRQLVIAPVGQSA
eukprot:GILK01002155.1.p1 GENE.GILK01002155.1~~GILK01002155.1.p1  ORF type:complete len:258 (-),score=35.04 GILK01002155.1:537-1262(-)